MYMLMLYSPSMNMFNSDKEKNLVYKKGFNMIQVEKFIVAAGFDGKEKLFQFKSFFRHYEAEDKELFSIEFLGDKDKPSEPLKVFSFYPHVRSIYALHNYKSFIPDVVMEEFFGNFLKGKSFEYINPIDSSANHTYDFTEGKYKNEFGILTVDGQKLSINTVESYI